MGIHEFPLYLRKKQIMDEKLQDQINKLEQDIESVKIQGATNVALATLSGMELIAQSSSENLLEDVTSVGLRLSKARENEPLARNSVKFVLSNITETDPTKVANQLKKVMGEFRELVNDAKERISDNAIVVLKEYDVILTHCHSSTATRALIRTSKMNSKLKVVSTETRPLMQGRKTAVELLEAGVDVTIIVDSAAASFIVDDRYLPVGAVVIGADEVLSDGSVINKVGSYAMALAAAAGKDQLFVLTTLLKVNPSKNEDNITIEMRSAKEVWKDAPENMKIINPSFEIVPSNLITAYITEIGVIKPDDLIPNLKKTYSWV